MGIFNRLGSVINSYMNDYESETSARLKTSSSFSRSDFRHSDPDLDAAYKELNDFLNNRDTHTGKKNTENAGQYSWKDNETEQDTKTGNTKFAGVKLPPQELREDFDLLGVSFDADRETCKAAYKKLLKIHHPDRHAGHEGNYKKATQKSAKINAAWDRIEKWRELVRKEK